MTFGDVMNRYEKKAIELRYNKQTYKQISKAVGGKISEGTLKNQFALGGRLYIPYLEYEASQNSWNEDNTRAEYKRQSTYVAKIKRQLLQKALKIGDFRLAFDIAKDIDDRAGVVVVRQSKINVETTTTKPLTNEQYAQELIRMGVDPRTGQTLPGFKPTES